MTFAVTADVHAHPYPGSATDGAGNNKQLSDIIAALDAMLTCTKEADARDIVIAGDLFHDRKGVRPEASHRVAEWIERCRAAKLAVHVLVGNHDLSIGGDGCTSAKALTGLASIYEAVTVTTLADGTRAGMLPYTDDPLAVRAAMKRFKADKVSVVFAHVGLGDPKLSACVPTDYEVPGHINVSDLRADDFFQVFLGHYHNAQKVAKNARYVGSPLQMGYKEAGQAKSFCLVTPSSVKTVPNTTSPCFHKLPYAEADKRVQDGSIPPTDSIWVTDVDEASVEALTKYAEETGARVRIERAKSVAVDVRIDASKPEFEILRSYVDAVTPSTVADKREALAAVGMDLMNKAAK